MARQWSNLQLAIFDAYENTNKNLFVNATAGSSKTTCMVECARRTPPNWKCLFMAFNKSIAEELSERLPNWFETATFHSKGFKVLLFHFKVRPKVNENKTFQMGKKFLKLQDMEFKEQNKYLFDIQTIWNQIRVNLIEEKDWEAEIPFICLEKEIEFKERMISDIQIIDEEWKRDMKKINKVDEFQLDFTDMLYVPYKMIDPMKFPKYDVVNLDEGQDLNVLQREMALRYLKPKGRFTIFGDFSQAIYSFQGASIDNFKYFQSLPNTIILPLSITYRCARAIVEEAKKVFPDNIEASPTAEEGIVRFGKLEEATEDDFVLCRNNLPLIEAFLQFIETKKRATIKGKDLGEALCRLLDKISTINDLDHLLDEKIQELMEKGMSKKIAMNNPSYIALEEKCTILKILHKRFLGTFTQLKEEIQRIFTDKTSGIVLCTCHRSKGLEADRVFFLNPELIPSDHAKTEKAKYAEQCLKFVAITRARKELVYCHI